MKLVDYDTHMKIIEDEEQDEYVRVSSKLDLMNAAIRDLLSKQDGV